MRFLAGHFFAIGIVNRKFMRHTCLFIPIPFLSQFLSDKHRLYK